jgi:hypothetical protein
MSGWTSGWRLERGRLVCPVKVVGTILMRQRLRKGKAEQERRARRAARRAEEIWSASSSQMREAERAPREALYRAEMTKWTIEGAALDG